MNTIKIDPERHIADIDRNIFGGFVEHLGRCVYGGIYEPGSSLADEHGFRKDVLEALRGLRMPLIRYPGGNFVSGYRWRDGVGPAEERPARTDLAWHDVESNRFGTNEFIQYCRKLGTEPYLVVNCGDGDLREARDWVEYCNGTTATELVKLRGRHGFAAPHDVRYWGIGNEVDGPWQIGFKSPLEYARACTEYAKAMKWVDPSIKVIASAVSLWEGDFLERTRLLLEHAGSHIDYLSLHWYVGNPDNDYYTYMNVPELLERRLAAIEGLVSAGSLQYKLQKPVKLAVDEWNVWYRTHPSYGADATVSHLEERYNLEDALVVAMQMNLFIRHARTVTMANLAQVVNVIAPVFTSPEGLFLQTIYHPFALYSRTCGTQAVDAWYDGEAVSGGAAGVPALDIAATLDGKRLNIYVVNRHGTDEIETAIRLMSGEFRNAAASNINGPDIKAENSFQSPAVVKTVEKKLAAQGNQFSYAFEPHSVTVLEFEIE